MDTVYSGKGCPKECLLTITERLARLEISRKIPDRTAASVKRELDKLERQMGCIPFQMLFKSLTADNGVEFSGAGDLEGSSLCNSQRTQLYFAHPYCSSERGTNENHNGIIRRFIPKGSDISLTGEQDVKEIQDWMNIYPRKILGGKTPLGRLKAEMGEGFTVPSFLEPTPR